MSENLSARVTEDMRSAMRAKDTATLAVLRGLKSACKYAAIEKYGAEGELDDAEVVAVVRKQIKQRQDSVASFDGAGRDDLVAKEKAEIVVLERYLPQQLSEDELVPLVDAVVAETGATTRKDMGEVMKVLQERTAGRADNKTLSRLVMARLN